MAQCKKQLAVYLKRKISIEIKTLEERKPFCCDEQAVGTQGNMLFRYDGKVMGNAKKLPDHPCVLCALPPLRLTYTC